MSAYRGLRRIWAVFSICWCILVVTGALGVQGAQPAGATSTATDRSPTIVSTMAIAAAFPAALLLFGIIYVRLSRARYAAHLLLPDGRWRQR